MPVSTQHESALGQWLAKHAVFGTLPASLRDRLEHGIERRPYAKGDVIYHELNNPGHLWVVKRGHVRLVRYSSSGRAFAFKVMGEGEIFCVAAVVNQCAYPCRAVADVEGELLKVPAPLFYELLERVPAFSRGVLKLVCQEQCHAHAQCLASQERVEQRLLASLLQLQGEFGAVIPLSRQQMAELAGVSRETANRMLLKFQKRGAVALGFRRLTVKDAGKLRAWLNPSGHHL